MTDEEIVKILVDLPINVGDFHFKFARAIEAKVREECAVICDEIAESDKKGWYSQIELEARQAGAISCAEAIRAEGKNEV